MSELITDEQILVSAKHKNNPIPVYDDGFGPIFLFINTWGPVCLIRAQSWSKAYEILEDEFQPESTETIEDIVKEYGENFYDAAGFQESYGFRPNGPNSSDKLNHGIYERDINGEMLEELTADRMERYEISFETTVLEVQ